MGTGVDTAVMAVMAEDTGTEADSDMVGTADMEDTAIMDITKAGMVMDTDITTATTAGSHV